MLVCVGWIGWSIGFLSRSYHSKCGYDISPNKTRYKKKRQGTMFFDFSSSGEASKKNPCGELLTLHLQMNAKNDYSHFDSYVYLALLGITSGFECLGLCADQFKDHSILNALPVECSSCFAEALRRSTYRVRSVPNSSGACLR